MPNYSKARFLTNVAYLMKRDNLRTGDLESLINVSTGYFSRLKNNESDTVCPEINTLSLLADKFNITITTLLYSDLKIITETELYVMSFLKKLIDDTNNNKLDWEQITETQIAETTAGFEESLHPLINPKYRAHGHLAQSLFNEDFYSFNGPVYKLSRSERDIYIQYLIADKNRSNSPDRTTYELYFYQNSQLRKVCNDTKLEFRDLLKALYEAAQISSRNVQIDDDVKKGIDEFLKDQDNLPF